MIPEQGSLGTFYYDFEITPERVSLTRASILGIFSAGPSRIEAGREALRWGDEIYPRARVAGIGVRGIFTTTAVLERRICRWYLDALIEEGEILKTLSAEVAEGSPKAPPMMVLALAREICARLGVYDGEPAVALPEEPFGL